jgi:hypothetical protein
MIFLHMLHDEARARNPLTMKNVSEEEIDSWGIERLLEECEKFNISLHLPEDKPSNVELFVDGGRQSVELTPTQRAAIPSLLDCPGLLQKVFEGCQRWRVSLRGDFCQAEYCPLV